MFAERSGVMHKLDKSKLKIIKEIGPLTEKGSTRIELNQVSWNGGKPTYELRRWSRDHTKIGKGIVLSQVELASLGRLIATMQGTAFDAPKESAPEESEPEPAEKTVAEKRLLSYKMYPLQSHYRERLRVYSERMSSLQARNILFACAQCGLVNRMEERYFMSFCKSISLGIPKSLAECDAVDRYLWFESVFYKEIGARGFNWEDAEEAFLQARYFYLHKIIEDAEDFAFQKKYDVIEPEVDKKDISTLDLAYLFASLPPQPDIVEFLDTLDIRYCSCHIRSVTWFAEQILSGDDENQIPNYSAKKAYSELLAPEDLLWIAAALGEKNAILEMAWNESFKRSSLELRCNTLRSYIPFDRIRILAGQWK